MIKVLIVDDEARLREGMRSLIPWEKYGYSVIDTAANALQALEKYEQLKPELMLVDIRMPGMDGLELIQRLRDLTPSLHLLIISGHADFDYARRAINYHVDGYLLKPVDEHELIRYLQRLRDTILHEQSQLQDADDMQASIHQVRLLNLLQPETGERPSATATEHVEALGIADAASYEVVLMEILSIEGELSQDLLPKVVTAAKTVFEHSHSRLFLSLPPYLCLLLTKPLQTEAEYTQLYEECARIIGAQGASFIAATGGAVSTSEEISVSAARARELIKQSFFYTKDKLLTPQSALQMSLEQENSPTHDRETLENHLLLAVETGNRRSAETIILQICQTLVALRSTEQQVKEAFIRLQSTILARLEAVSPDIRLLTKDKLPALGAVHKCRYMQDLLVLSQTFFGVLADQFSRGKGNEVLQIIELIQRSYHENLKLETLSEIFNYSSAYLGKLFKNATGEYFNTYVDKVRIEKAKELLLQGMKVYEVAERVGYFDSDYFNAKFRKYVGSSPTSFRKSSSSASPAKDV